MMWRPTKYRETCLDSQYLVDPTWNSLYHVYPRAWHHTSHVFPARIVCQFSCTDCLCWTFKINLSESRKLVDRDIQWVCETWWQDDKTHYDIVLVLHQTWNDRSILQGCPRRAPVDSKSWELLARCHDVYVQGSHKYSVDSTKLLWESSPSSRPPCRPSARQTAHRLPMSTSHQCNHSCWVRVKVMMEPTTNHTNHAIKSPFSWNLSSKSHWYYIMSLHKQPHQQIAILINQHQITFEMEY